MAYVSNRSAEARELSGGNMTDAGYQQGFPDFPAFRRTILHMPAPTSDWPLVRPSGPEPEGLGFFDGLSDNERSLLMAGAVAGGIFLLMRRGKGRR